MANFIVHSTSNTTIPEVTDKVIINTINGAHNGSCVVVNDLSLPTNGELEFIFSMKMTGHYNSALNFYVGLIEEANEYTFTAPYGTVNNVTNCYLANNGNESYFSTLSQYRIIFNFTTSTVALYNVDSLIAMSPVNTKNLVNKNIALAFGIGSYGYAGIADIQYVEIKHNNVVINENIFLQPKFLVKSNNQYYSTDLSYYNTETKTYNPLTIKDITLGESISKIMKSKSINGETFSILDKFKNFKLVLQNDKRIVINGIKSNKELVVGKQSFSTKIASNIDFFNLDDNAHDIKISFSIDDGTTWKTWNIESNSFEDISITIPNKEFDTLTSEELIQWNNAKNVIYNNGINLSLLKTLDFNKLPIEKIKFAYVLSATNAIELSTMKNLIWQFDAKGVMELCSTSDIAIQLSNSGVILKPKINAAMLKTNITYEGIGGGTSSDLVIDKTDEDIQNDINEVWKIDSSK